MYHFVSNKWYFDELYDFLFVRPSLWLGRLFWKRGDEGTIDRFGPHGAAYAVGVGQPDHRPAPVGLSLFLCAGHAARPDRRCHLGDLVGQVNGLPLLSLLIVVPLLAGVLCLFVKAQGGALDRAHRRR